MLSVGVPKEIKQNEGRVALTPQGTQALVANGIEVFVESSAGVGSTLADIEYEQAGAIICDAKTAWAQNLVLKVKEPQQSEFTYFREDLVLFTFLHLAAYPQVAQALIKAKTTGIGYETVTVAGQLPLLSPMSEIAGKLSVQVAAHFLEKPHGGRGVLLSGATGVDNAKVTVVGAGHVGLNAALIATGMGADVELIDINEARLETINKQYPRRFTTKVSSPETISNAVAISDAVIGGVLVPGGRAPIVVTREMISSMRTGSVVVDTAIDQGGCIETSKETTHENPTYIVDDVVHYAVGNMPGAVPNTSTYALANATLPYVIELATNGVDEAVKNIEGLTEGINTRAGLVTNDNVRDALGA